MLDAWVGIKLCERRACSAGGGRTRERRNFVVRISQKGLPARIAIPVELLLRSHLPLCWQRHHDDHVLRTKLEDPSTTVQTLLRDIGSRPNAIHLGVQERSEKEVRRGEKEVV